MSKTNITFQYSIQRHFIQCHVHKCSSCFDILILSCCYHTASLSTVSIVVRYKYYKDKWVTYVCKRRTGRTLNKYITGQSRIYLVRVDYQSVPFVYVFGCSLYVVIRGASSICQVRYPGRYWSATGSSAFFYRTFYQL